MCNIIKDRSYEKQDTNGPCYVMTMQLTNEQLQVYGANLQRRVKTFKKAAVWGKLSVRKK